MLPIFLLIVFQAAASNLLEARGSPPRKEPCRKWPLPAGVQKAPLCSGIHPEAPVIPGKGSSESRQHTEPPRLLLGACVYFRSLCGSSSLRVSLMSGQTGMGILELVFSCSGCTIKSQCDMETIYCPTCPVCQERQARRRERSESRSKQTGQECFVFLSSFGPDEAAPSRSCMRMKRSCTQIRTGPSLCLAESGWKLPLWILQSLPRCRQWQ